MKNTVAVHPAYWRHGHARKLVQWGLDLADQENMVVGVCAAVTGKKLFESLGFVDVQEVVVEGYKEHPDSITAWIGLRQPVGGKGAGTGQDGDVRFGGGGGRAEGIGMDGDDGEWEDCGKGNGSGKGEGSRQGGTSGASEDAGLGKA